MRNYIIRRMLSAVVIIFFITVINYFLINLAPGNAVDMMVDPNLSAAAIEAKKELFGLNAPIYIRYWRWLCNIFQGDFGYSYYTFQPVFTTVVSKIGPTLLLTGTSLLLSLLISIPLGIISATKQYSKMDNATTTFTLFLISMPAFILGLTLVYICGAKLNILPASGMFSLGKNITFMDRVKHLILPVLSLAAYTIGIQSRYVRFSMLEVLDQQYLCTARAKGLKENRVIWVHAFRNALNPIVSITGLQVAQLLGGSVIIEYLFSWPGLGSLTYISASQRDYPMLMAINLVIAIMVLLANLLTDIAYTIVDPRVKL